jgi:hypothetical protein
MPAEASFEDVKVRIRKATRNPNVGRTEQMFLKDGVPRRGGVPAQRSSPWSRIFRRWAPTFASTSLAWSETSLRGNVLKGQNRLISMAVLFPGTPTPTSVYPREAMARSLAMNAAGVILAHNYSIATVQPSRAEEPRSHTLKATLTVVDIRVMDHGTPGSGAVDGRTWSGRPPARRIADVTRHICLSASRSVRLRS